jgi:hypothetical protein
MEKYRVLTLSIICKESDVSTVQKEMEDSPVAQLGAYMINCGSVRDLTDDEWDEFSCAYPDVVHPEGI